MAASWKPRWWIWAGGKLGFSTSTTADKLVGGSSIKAEITVTDAAGNSTTKSDSEDYSVDTVAPELGIDLDPIVVGDDNTVNKAEADDKASVTLSGTVRGDAKVGDNITLTLGDGSKLETRWWIWATANWTLAPAPPPTNWWVAAASKPRSP
ncbi:hypothetical protein VCHC61A2_2433 [Vibrio cholerae HC-61A2]|uniref:Ig-like domain-containing protein n=1 Tax=Vibrio cholerae TaxID=666 RepID=UPI00028DBEBE|nr:hypothetical protein VCHC61A2_2433 [Vibrio cholerae HC-61A2]